MMTLIAERPLAIYLQDGPTLMSIAERGLKAIGPDFAVSIAEQSCIRADGRIASKAR
jgi:hypothetical protein